MANPKIDDIDSKEKNLNANIQAVHTLDDPHGEITHEKQIAEDLIAAEHEYTDRQFSRLRLKFSAVILPILCCIYGLALCDKTSLASGVVFSLRQDTHMDQKQYANLTVWFYLAYLVGQTPMTYVLQRWSLGRGLGVTATLWGLVLIGIGACNNYAQLSVLRTLLGWFECPLTTGYFLLVASWYTREEATFVNALFLSMNQLLGGGIFSVVLYALAKHSVDHGGVAGWRLMNYFLGGITTGFGILSLVFVGLPKETWWLSAEEKRMVKARIVQNASGGGEQHPWKWYQVREAFKDPQIYFVIMFNMLTNIPNGVNTTFGTLVTKSFGFTSLESILYNQPGNAIGFVATIFCSWISMKYPKLRFPFAVALTVGPTICYLYIGLAPNGGKWQRWVAYSFTKVSAAPVYLVWPLVAINVAGRTKRSTMGIAQFITYCVGNMIGAIVVLPSDAPRYLKSLTICAILYVAKSICLALWWAYYVWQNKKRDLASRDDGLTKEERDVENRLAGQLDQTDMENKHFRYLA